MAAYFNLNNMKYQKMVLVNKCDVILDHLGRFMLNDQKSLCLMNHRDILGSFRSTHLRCSVKEVVSKKFSNFAEHPCVGVSFH